MVECERCKQPLPEGQDGRVILKRADGTVEFTRQICNACFYVVSQMLITPRASGRA